MISSEELNKLAIERTEQELKEDPLPYFNVMSHATGRFNYVRKYIYAVGENFEKMSKLYEDNGLEKLKYLYSELNKAHQEIVDGKDLKFDKYLKEFFHIREFKSNLKKKKAMAIYLKHYISILESSLDTIDFSEYEKLDFEGMNSKYFNNEYIFRQMLDVVKENI